MKADHAINKKEARMKKKRNKLKENWKKIKKLAALTMIRNFYKIEFISILNFSLEIELIFKLPSVECMKVSEYLKKKTIIVFTFYESNIFRTCYLA